ncbi:hypothetical protein SK128_027968 [Halocaridina rubra]|uniref:histone acetyltransferase n=1 Tax=Halocaridina rubra TaxID=373956 RepID=A0AAN8WSZ1_HALRR
MPNPPHHLPAAIGGVTAKEWQLSISNELRNHLVHKFVQAIFPNPGPQAMLDKRMQYIFAYAREKERNIFEMADSVPEYYHLLSANIFRIQEKLEERRLERKNSPQDGVSGAAAPGPGPGPSPGQSPAQT